MDVKFWGSQEKERRGFYNFRWTPIPSSERSRSNLGGNAGDPELETGLRLGTHASIWIRPGVGLRGQEVSGGYNAYLQAGVRYMFGEPLREKIPSQLGSKRE